jgi:hypothetical protein
MQLTVIRTSFASVGRCQVDRFQSSLTGREGFGRWPLHAQTIGVEPAGPIGRPNERIDHNRTYITFAGPTT